MIESLLLLLPLLLLSVVVHEVAHGVAAEWWGDPTARMLGRITMNPIPHIDLFGSILVPGLLLMTGSGILFGWAKPVPVTPQNYRDRKLGDITVSLAGPASNVALAIGLAVVLVVVGLATGGNVPRIVWMAGSYGIFLNFILAVFNLIPIPPLDGSHVVANLLPPRTAYAYQSVGQYGLLIFIGIFFFLPGALGWVFLPARIATGALLEIVSVVT